MKPVPIMSKQPIVIRKPPRPEPEPIDDIWVLRSEVDTNTSNKVTVSSSASTSHHQKQTAAKGPSSSGLQTQPDNVPVTGVVIAQPRVLTPQPYIFSTPMSIVSSTTPANSVGGASTMADNFAGQMSGKYHPSSNMPIGLNPPNFPVNQPHLISPTTENPPGMFHRRPEVSTVTGVCNSSGPPSKQLPPEPRPPPPPPPPRLTPVAYSTSSKSSSNASVPAASSSSSSMSNNTSSGSSNASSSNTIGSGHHRAENPIIAQNRLQPGNHGPAFHESPDEGYHEDDGGSETM